MELLHPGNIHGHPRGNPRNPRVPLVLGMQLSAADESLAIVHFALDQGIRVLDCQGDDDLHRTEHLVRHTLDRWHGPKDQVTILTKVPSGHPDHLRQSVDEILLAQGVDRLFLFQFDARDSRVPVDETLAALADLQRQGKVEHLGLCNVTPAELHQAKRHFHVATVQNELSVLHRDSTNNGLVMLTQEQGIMFLASNPLGRSAKSSRVAKDRILLPLSHRHQVSPQEMALAALLDAGPHIVPIIEATSIESVRSCLAAARISLDVSDRTALVMGMSFAPDSEALAAIRQQFVEDEPPKTPEPVQKKSRRPIAVKLSFVIPSASWAKARPCFGLAPTPEVVIVMGIQGAGKSFFAYDYEGRGYDRIGRGRKDDLLPRLHQALEERHKLVVLDDNYPTRLSRAPVIAVAHSHGLPVRCTHLQIPLAEAQVNVTQRMVERYGRLLDPEEMKTCRRTNSSVVTPADLQRWLRGFEPSTIEEGFLAVDTIPFVRRLNPAHKQKGLLLDVDGTLRRSRSGAAYPCHPDDVEILPCRFETLLRRVASGYHLFFVSNQNGIAEGKLTREMADATFQRTVELLRLPVTEIAYCPHQANPVVCWCRKPMPGLGVFLTELHRLDRKHLVVVGNTDAEFAAGLGARFLDAKQFFGGNG